MKRLLCVAALFLAFATVSKADDPCNGNCLPTGQANEIGPSAGFIPTEDYPWIRATIWCISTTVSCQGTTFVDARTGPSTPWTVMHAITNPKTPDADGMVCAQDSNGNYLCDVYLDPRMHDYRCRLRNYATGTHGCQIERIK